MLFRSLEPQAQQPPAQLDQPQARPQLKQQGQPAAHQAQQRRVQGSVITHHGLLERGHQPDFIGSLPPVIAALDVTAQLEIRKLPSQLEGVRHPTLKVFL